MSVPPESIEVGQCYPTDAGQVRRVLSLLPGNRVQFEHRTGTRGMKTWRSGMLDLRSFAFSAEHLVSCDWTPESDE